LYILWELICWHRCAFVIRSPDSIKNISMEKKGMYISEIINKFDNFRFEYSKLVNNKRSIARHQPGILMGYSLTNNGYVRVWSVCIYGPRSGGSVKFSFSASQRLACSAVGTTSSVSFSNLSSGHWKSQPGIVSFCAGCVGSLRK